MRLGYIMFAGALMMLASLLKESDSLAIHRDNMSEGVDHENDYYDSLDTCIDCDQEANVNYEDSMEVKGDDLLFRSTAADEKSGEIRFSRNNFHRPSPAAQKEHLSIYMDRDNDDELLERQKMLTSQHDRQIIDQSNLFMDTSDEESSWEVKDESLKKLFGIYWESIKNKKRNIPSIEDLPI